MALKRSLEFCLNLTYRYRDPCAGPFWPQGHNLNKNQDGCHGLHLGYWNETFLAILNLNLAILSPTKIQLNLSYGWGDVILRIARWSS